MSFPSKSESHPMKDEVRQIITLSNAPSIPKMHSTKPETSPWTQVGAGSNKQN